MAISLPSPLLAPVTIQKLLLLKKSPLVSPDILHMDNMPKMAMVAIVVIYPRLM